ncbi:hypothetical protein N7456_000985 [Penicillium angulare]|uniref:Uncharacterized protein n=1 Tax=Penicillium angulare TaxID=116970 RepID=A0A9W9GD84_9EURO|nr:hypothetical protein N7456_000985 [Penicillium angulare]
MHFLSQTVVPAFDNNAFADLSSGKVLAKTAGWQGRGSYTLICTILRVLATEAELGIIPLGTIQGLESLGWLCSYMLVGSSYSSMSKSKTTARRFRRLRIMLLANELSVDKPSAGQFYIY